MTAPIRPLGDIIAARFSRRDLLRGRPRRHGDFNTTPSFTFKEARADDRHDVADGYDADLLIRWGDAVLARTGRNDGLWALETEGEARGTSKHFFRCPNGAELCGPYFTPTTRPCSLSCSIPEKRTTTPRSPCSYDKPSTRWPDFQPNMPPRPAIVAVTRRGGGKIAG